MIIDALNKEKPLVRGFTRCSIIFAFSVLNRKNLPGYFHTFSKDGVCNLQYMLGEGQMNNFQELVRMNYSGATCIVDYTKPHLVKVYIYNTHKFLVCFSIMCFRSSLKDVYWWI